MKPLVLPLLLVLVGLLTTEALVVNLTLGTEDSFVTSSTNREWVPRTGNLLTCTTYNWTRVPQPGNFEGDAQAMSASYFDTKPKDTALIWSVTGLPTDAVLQNARIEMSIKCEDALCHNDGFGFMWDDTTCRIQYFRPWTNLTGFGNWTTTNVRFVNISLTSDLKISSSKSVLQKIQETGFFHFLVGDDTSVDYFRLFYTVPDPPSSSLVSFACTQYLLGRTLTRQTVVYSDTTATTITGIVDSATNPFTSTSLISTANVDRNVTQSTFKFNISQSSRFWLFVPSGVTLSWISAGGWDLLSGASVNTTTSGTTRTFSVYTKRYEGARWVTFGGASAGSVSPAMFFVSWAFSPTLVVIPSNPAAVCACESTGDPHYVTWDNRRFDFYTPGTYHLVKARDCSFDVQTLTFKYGSTVTVNGIVSVRYLNDIVTLARTPGASGAAWTGSPVVRVNGVQKTATTTQGGLQVNRITADQWTIVVASVGLTVKTVASGNWFHVYPTLSDPSYQRKVDGLCGNCDNNPDNDFMTTGCAMAINNTATKLTSAQVVTWGAGWAVPANQLVADLSLLTSTNAGQTSYSSCTAAPIIQQCPSLIPPEPPKTTGTTTTNVVEPQPPTTFVSCSSGKPVHCGDDDDDNDNDDDNDDNDDDDDDNDDDDDEHEPPRLCTWRPDYNQIRTKCTECANQKLYATDDCILDVCQILEAGKTIADYTCPPGLEICTTTTITRNVTIGSYDWATLDNANPDGLAPTQAACQQKPLYIPLGWEIAPNDETSKSVIASKTWETACLAVKDGVTYGTLTTKAEGFTGSCPVHSCVVEPEQTCYHPNYCGLKVLLRRPRTARCGNGIMETGEQCDDGNTDDADGCSNSCRINDTEWICVTTVNPSKCTTATNNEAGDPKHKCLINSQYCDGCVITVENQKMDTCCKCDMPCCD